MHTVQPTAADKTGARISLYKASVWRGIAGLISIGLALFAVFGLSAWAEITAGHHAVQHVLLFLGGVGFGGSLLSFGRRGGEQ